MVFRESENCLPLSLQVFESNIDNGVEVYLLVKESHFEVIDLIIDDQLIDVAKFVVSEFVVLVSVGVLGNGVTDLDLNPIVLALLHVLLGKEVHEFLSVLIR